MNTTIHSTTLDGPPRLLDVHAAAEATGLEPRVVRRLFDERQVPLVKVGARALRVWSTDLAAYLDARRVPARNGGAR